jgi:hypothetical protein
LKWGSFYHHGVFEIAIFAMRELITLYQGDLEEGRQEGYSCAKEGRRAC